MLKLLLFLKLLLLAFLSLIGFFLVQGECEMIIKPELQNEFSVIKGIGAVYFLGFILLIIGAAAVCLLVSVIASVNRRKQV